MRVGSLEETLTVTGDAPLVDVQRRPTQVLTRDVLDAIPTGRSFQSVGQLVVGVQLSRPDVGGSQGMQQTYFRVHGMTSRNTTVQVDGMMMNSTRGDNQVNPYFNDAMSQEVSYETTGAGADMSGGRRAHQHDSARGRQPVQRRVLHAWYSDGAWQADNLTQDLKDQGLTAVDKIDKIYDVNFSIGGPVRQDKLWFFTSARKWGVNSPVADVFYTPAGRAVPGGLRRSARPGRSAASRRSTTSRSRAAWSRLTWQMSRKNKLGVYYDRLYKTRGHDMLAATDPRTASFTWRRPCTTRRKSSGPPRSATRLLLDAGYGSNVNMTVQNMQDGRRKGAWHGGVVREGGAHSIATLGPTWAATNNIPTFVPTKILCRRRPRPTSPARTPSSRRAVADRLVRARGRTRKADLQQDYRTGVPDSVVDSQHPVPLSRHDEPRPRSVRAGLLDVQAADVNGGIRLEGLNAREQPGAHVGAGRFVPAAVVSEDAGICRTGGTSRRGSASAYDLFGNAKTALKFSIEPVQRLPHDRHRGACTTRWRRRPRGSPGGI